MPPLAALAIVAATVVGAELAAAAFHRFVMHGPGWAWHRSHHEPGARRWERNDLYAVAFASADVALFALAGGPGHAAWWVALGIAVYGLAYAWVHDGLVHRRWAAGRVPARGWLARLASAHRLHHAVRGRDGAVSFGFLWAPPPERLARTLRARRVALDGATPSVRADSTPSTTEPTMTVPIETFATLAVGETGSRLDAPGPVDARETVATFAVGARDLVPGPFRGRPPSALELETAIATVEDALLPVVRRVPPSAGLALRVDGPPGLARGLADALGAEPGDMLPIDEVERAFDALAAIAQGRPASSAPSLADPDVAATLTIVREALHHLGLRTLRLPKG